MTSPDWLSLKGEIQSSLEGAYPSEGCGLLLEREGRWIWRECANLADIYHAREPASYPRNARTSYIIDPVEILQAERRGETVRVIVHSHVDSGPEFSPEDTRVALMGSARDGFVPAYPGVEYLVVSVEDGALGGARIYRYIEGVFVAQDVSLD